MALSQLQLAKFCDKTREAIGRYERGDNFPGGKMLAQFAAVGGDIQYILTGRRSLPHHPTTHDQAMLMLYNSLSADDRKIFFKSLEEKARLRELEAMLEDQVQGKKM